MGDAGSLARCHRHLRGSLAGGPLQYALETDWLAEQVGLELRNVVAKYPFERSHGFPGIQPNSGHRDYSRLSCACGNRSTASILPILDIKHMAEVGASFVYTPASEAFAVTGRKRLAGAPDIPTVGEEGLPRLHALNWQAVYLPKGAATEVIAKLNSAVVAALADASVRRQLADIGQEIFSRDQQTPEALRAFQRAEIEKWWPIIKAANMKAN